MRRQLKLDDYQIPSQQIKVSSNGIGGNKAIGMNTEQFQMKSIRIETLVHNGQKQSFSQQITPYLISEDYRKQQKQKISPKHKRTQFRDDTAQLNQQNFQDQDEPQQQNLSEQTQKKLSRFLKKVSPLMQNQLYENLPLYTAFGTEIQQGFFKRDTKLTFTLQNLDHPNQQSLQISDLAWNATGITVAASYAKSSHQGTCSHKSFISLWFIYKRNFKPTKPQTIPVQSCISCLNFHPKKPSILACGSYNGQVLLYDFSRKQQQLIAKTTVDDYFHRDLITQLTWWAYRIPGRTQTDYNLLSLATDGKILLWQIPNSSLIQQAENIKSKLLKFPLKGFLMLRKKQGKIIPVSALSINQSKINRNMFIIGSEGGSILRGTLTPLIHHHNTQSKVILDLQQQIKFRQKVYPFLLNIPSKNLPDVKRHIEQYCVKHKIKDVDNLGTIFASRPQMRSLYPNPISFAYQPLAYPISSISDNRYGLFVANACDGYSRMYIEGNRKSIESIEQGWQWAWIDGGSRLGGFIEQQWVILDFLSEQVVFSIGVGQATIWRQSGYQIAVGCQRTKVKIIQLGDKFLGQDENRRKQIYKKIQQLRINE